MRIVMKAAQAKRNDPDELDGLDFENRFVAELPADPVLANIPSR